MIAKYQPFCLKYALNFFVITFQSFKRIFVFEMSPFIVKSLIRHVFHQFRTQTQ
jgi:hypothetical protein